MPSVGHNAMEFTKGKFAFSDQGWERFKVRCHRWGFDVTNAQREWVQQLFIKVLLSLLAILAAGLLSVGGYISVLTVQQGADIRELLQAAEVNKQQNERIEHLVEQSADKERRLDELEKLHERTPHR